MHGVQDIMVANILINIIKFMLTQKVHLFLNTETYTCKKFYTDEYFLKIFIHIRRDKTSQITSKTQKIAKLTFHEI